MEGDKKFENILFLFFTVSVFDRKSEGFSVKLRMENLELRNGDFGENAVDFRWQLRDILKKVILNSLETIDSDK